MSRGPGRTQRRIVEVLRDARTVEPWPVWMTVYGLAHRVYEVEYVTRAQVESVRRACRAASGIEYRWAHLDVPTEHSITGKAERWIGKARLTPDPVEAEMWKAWQAPPVVRSAHPHISDRVWDAPVDVPYYLPPDRDALADAVVWHLVRTPVSVDKDSIITLFNTYASDRPLRLEDYAQPCYVCGTPTTRASSGLTKYPDCGQHIEPPQPCHVCGRPLGQGGGGVGRNGLAWCNECLSGTVDALALAGVTR